MKALVLKEYKNLVFEDAEKPAIGDEDVLVKVHACGICGSDIHGMDGSSGRRQPPVIMGHEASGVIEELGAKVSNWQAGERVTFDSTVYCGECWYCKHGLVNLCDNRRVLGVSCDDYRQNGAFAEYVAVPQRILYRLPDNVTFEQAAMVEPVSVAVHAVELTPVSSKDTVVVFGAGMIGLLVIQALRAKGCDMIIAVDLEQRKLDLAVKLGADFGLRADTCDVVTEILRNTRGMGADFAFEVIGITPTVRDAVECLRKGGRLTLVGNLSPDVELPLQSVVTRQLTLSGSCASSGEYPICLNMISKGLINVDALISASPSLSDGAQWFDRLYNNEAGLMKVILKP